MTIAYTVCSANYLPFAKSLADSLVQHNPDYRFVIGLADTYRDYDSAFFAPHQIIPVHEMHISSLDEMNAKYTMFELSCALKPFVAEYLFQTNNTCDAVFYFDSDILLYGRLSLAETMLQNHSILLTPHISTPQVSNGSIETELDVLRTGLYNAGFFGLRRAETTMRFLNWWKERLKDYCFNDAAHGLFVDQLWLDIVPLYFRDTFILYDPGYNLAYWNFNERQIEKKEGRYIVNETSPLAFFHYSGYDIDKPDVISKHQKAHSFDDRPQYKLLFENYASAIQKNNSPGFLSLPTTMGSPTYSENVVSIPEKKSFKQKIKKLFNGSGL
ncbi:MAG: glycosyl transferase [Flavobacterium sp.]|nr:MAG: glycosyl transferase [Flavobacterium sp.]